MLSPKLRREKANLVYLAGGLHLSHPDRYPHCFRRATVCVMTMLALLASRAHGGGDAWLAEIQSFKLDSNGLLGISLRPVEVPSADVAGCRLLEMTVQYDWPRWPWADRPTTAAEHWQAVGYLRHAFDSHSSVRVGSMGEGWAKAAQAPCVVHSRGLRVVEGAVFSFYKWP